MSEQVKPASEHRPDIVAPAWTNLIEYVLQDDLHNRLTPRVVDIAYTAFMLAKEPNKENGGNSDWFNDTKPSVMSAIKKLRKDLIEYAAPQTDYKAQRDALLELIDHIGDDGNYHLLGSDIRVQIFDAIASVKGGE